MFRIASLALVLASCRETTQISVQLETDVNCNNIQAFSFVAGAPVEVHNQGPKQLFLPTSKEFSCKPSGNGNIILGIFVVAPEKQGSNSMIGIDAYLRLSGDATAKNGHACEPGTAGCIFVPVTVSYLPNRTINLFLRLSQECEQTTCAEGRACFQGNKCQSNLIVPTECVGSTCSVSTTIPPDAGFGGGSGGGGFGGGTVMTGGGTQTDGGGDTDGGSDIDAGTCVAGIDCTVQSNLCKVGKTSCDTGILQCLAVANKPRGETCGTNQVCNAFGDCEPLFLPFAPSYFDAGILVGLDAGSGSGWVVNSNETYNTSSNVVPIGASLSALVDIGAGSVARLVAASSFSVATGRNLTLTGPYPLIVVARENVSVGGVVLANSEYAGNAGPGSRTAIECGASTGQNGRSALFSTALIGSGASGGSLGSVGGSGGDVLPLVPHIFGADAGLVDSQVPTLFRAGCPGGIGGTNGTAGAMIPGGKGGGALYLIAGQSITVLGTVSVSGSGVSANAFARTGGSAGGSGGMIVLESSALQLTNSFLTANGGGGGHGRATMPTAVGMPSENGKVSSVAVALGATYSGIGGFGGNGAAGAAAAADGATSTGCNNAGCGGGGGCGGAGVIVIKSRGPAGSCVTAGATISPQKHPTSICP
jgi:hypothetical protein